ncbi:MAG: hypothetical protein KY460_06375 [Actinobacteria bacterium]|nr:hypothetical protein [Actinomycetota bacterium]
MDHHVEAARQVYGCRPWILATGVLASAPAQLAELRAVGVDDVLVLAGSHGTGALPDDDDAIVLGVRGTTMMDAVHGLDRALADVPAAVRTAVDRFDPEHRAGVIPPMFSHLSTIAERRVWGARPAPWRALENKTVVDQLWDAAGVPRAASVVVPADTEALRSAARGLDHGRGTVWVADNWAGWHGGASGLRWVRTAEEADTAAAFMADRADQVRVMQFLDGVPCSIHGMVLQDATVAFRPCEMVVLRRPGRTDLCYAGMATMWDPPEEDRRQMRGYARRVGAHLRETVGYRGAFTIDGVMTADGFRPTELNPRFGAALAMLAPTADLPLYLLHLAAVEGVDLQWRPDELERAVIERADESRTARCHVVVDRVLDSDTMALRRGPSGLEPTDDASGDVILRSGPAPAGGIVLVELADAAVAAGASVNPLVAEALGWADRRWALGLGVLEPAMDVRR